MSQDLIKRNEDGPHTVVRIEDDRTGMHPVTLERAVFDHLHFTCVKDERSATLHDVYKSVALAARDRLAERWKRTLREYYASDVKRVYYLSAEFLLGRMLAENLMSLGLFDTARDLLRKNGIELADVLEQELDPGLGNGGLGRLAACFLESMATLGYPGYGYGIRYEFGIFEQQFREGWQLEVGDAWLRFGNPWEIPRHEYTVAVSFGGRVEESIDPNGRFVSRWVDTEKVLGVPYDTPIAGYGTETVNTLRLWSARASKEFNLQVFNDGDYRHAVEEKAISESISKVLYPKDESPQGRELRLKQQYFFVACSIRDIVRRYTKTHSTFHAFPDKAAIQLNDTHPAIAVAELMRVLVDEEGLVWDFAWEITRRTIAYTNHTLLPEALEKWPVAMFERILPRHLRIIYEINSRFLRQVHVHSPGDFDMQRRTSIIEEGAEKQVRMAHLAVVGSHSVNGVAELHSQLVKTQLFPDFARLWPERFNNKTNGVTPRRWILEANPALAAAITRRIGDTWVKDLERLEGLSAYAEDESFLAELERIKLANKTSLAHYVARTHQLDIDPASIFDVQVKRIHEYKRQLLACLHVISLYLDLKRDPTRTIVPRTVLFAGKAAPGYVNAKLHIKLINDVSEMVNCDPSIRGLLRVAFLPNYSVTLAQRVIPAADLSEQISLAGKEASGTGNMKFAMNGALTIGTLDGANVEIRDEVGPDNFFLFGLDADRVKELKQRGYRPSEFIERSPRLREVVEAIESGYFCPDEPERFRPVGQMLRQSDPYLVCADFDDYVACQTRVSEAFRDRPRWTRMVVANLAHSGRFSSDRTIKQYAGEIWSAKPVDVPKLVRRRASDENGDLR